MKPHAETPPAVFAHYSPVGRPIRVILLLAIATAAVGVLAAFTPSGLPLATGKAKFLGCCYSSAQLPYFENYFNQITPENGGKWGTVEYTRGAMNWTEADAAYAYAKARGFKYRQHILVWGSQQPSWISSLSTADKRSAIENWFSSVAARYPDLDYIEVVNEPLHAPPNGDQIAYSNPAVYAANYADALSMNETGNTGWDWIIGAFKLARAKFPGKKLVLNEYGVLGSAYSTNQYLSIINLLKAENLIDVIAVQCHAFETSGVPATTLSTNLAALAATGLPIMITEMDIDGSTDQMQLAEYQRVFPVFWNHPSVVGITLWGYRPGMWRSLQGANLVLSDNTERPAMAWLRSFVGNNAPVVSGAQYFRVDYNAVNGTVLGTVQATDADAGTTFHAWVISGGTGASYFALDATTGQLTVSNRAGLNLAGTASYTLQISVSDGMTTSLVTTVTVLTPASSVSLVASPSSTTVAVGGNASFTVIPDGDTAPLSFQWQRLAAVGGGWSDLSNGGAYSGVTGATLTVAGVTPAMSGDQFRCVVSNGVGAPAISAAATLTSGKYWAPIGLGDFNADGSADIVLRNSSTGETGMWLMRGAAIASGAAYATDGAWAVTHVADFSGDGKADLLWRNSSTGAMVLWFMNGTANTGATWIYDSGLSWVVDRLADFNGDGKSDLLWYNSTTNQYAIWLMNGGSVLAGSAYALGGDWRAVQAADFNGDGKSDLLWRNVVTGGVVEWQMDGTSIAASGWLYDSGADWEPTHVADFNGDGTADVIWTNSVTGDTALWLLDGLGVLDGALLQSGSSGWQVYAVADFNGDGKVDLVWRDPRSGRVAAWLMDGKVSTAGALLYDSGLSWMPVRFRTFDGDAKADILWQNTDGSMAIWMMNGLSVAGGAGLY